MFCLGDCTAGAATLSCSDAFDRTSSDGCGGTSALPFGPQFGARTVRPLPPSNPWFVCYAVVMSQLASAIYLPDATLRTNAGGGSPKAKRAGGGGAVYECYQKLGHSVAWLVTDTVKESHSVDGNNVGGGQCIET